jgi:hypothetical protein
MPITRKPKPSNGHSPKVDVDELIGRGGSPARGNGRVRNYKAIRIVEIPVIVRIPQPDLISVDSLVQRRPVKTPRHTWLLEAIHEKIMREKAEAARLLEGRGRRGTDNV